MSTSLTNKSVGKFTEDGVYKLESSGFIFCFKPEYINGFLSFDTEVTIYHDGKTPWNFNNYGMAICESFGVSENGEIVEETYEDVGETEDGLCILGDVIMQVTALRRTVREIENFIGFYGVDGSERDEFIKSWARFRKSAGLEKLFDFAFCFPGLSLIESTPVNTSEQKKKTRKQKVYFIHDSSNNKIKIGKSNNPEQRLKTLQTGSAGLLTLLKVTTRMTEDEAHLRFRGQRERGEWFRLEGELATYLSSK